MEKSRHCLSEGSLCYVIFLPAPPLTESEFRQKFDRMEVRRPIEIRKGLGFTDKNGVGHPQAQARSTTCSAADDPPPGWPSRSTIWGRGSPASRRMRSP